MTLTQGNGITYLALGDSYTIGESASEFDRYPVILAHELKKNLIPIYDTHILATTAWTTENLKKAIQNSDIKNNKYDLVSLLIGVNNEYQGKNVNEYKTEFRELLLMAIEFAHGIKDNVFVLSIPDYGYTPFGEPNQKDISARIDKFNNANKHITDSIGVRYFDITPLSRKGMTDPHLIASDGLHYTGKMYRLWVDLIKKDIIQIARNI